MFKAIYAWFKAETVDVILGDLTSLVSRLEQSVEYHTQYQERIAAEKAWFEAEEVRVKAEMAKATTAAKNIAKLLGA